jgi:hypothetical protein
VLGDFMLDGERVSPPHDVRLLLGIIPSGAKGDVYVDDLQA